MTLFSPYMISWLFIFLVIGALWYVFDRRVGVRIYRWYYDMTHEHPLSQEQQQGFIFNRRAKPRFAAAIALSVVQSVIVVLAGGASPMAELLTFFLEVPVLMVGFYLGPLADRLWRRKDRILETVDKLEDGKIDLKKEFQDVSQKATNVIRDALTLGGQSPSMEEDRKEENQDAPADQEEELSSGNEEPDPRKMMDSYLRREAQPDE